ncbi:Gar1/Naf1 RNA binding region-domain-containing protein, partial [Clohesyomyces aquaticus]
MESVDDLEGAAKAEVRTVNEVPDIYEKPNITVTPDMKIIELGKVESIVDNLVLVKANVSGDYQVLESASVLCLADRTVIGKIAETLGRVQEPRYSLGFNEVSE